MYNHLELFSNLLQIETALDFWQGGLDFLEGCLNFWQGSLDFWQGALDLQQSGLDLWQFGKILKVALSASLKPTAAQDLEPGSMQCLRRTSQKKKWPDTLMQNL